MTLAGGAAHALDPKAADISGIRLYMTKAEVIAAIRARFGPTKRFDVETTARLLSPGNRVDVIEVRDGIYHLTVNFVERAPPHNTAVEVVERVAMSLSNDASESDYAQFYSSVMRKYGVPVAGKPERLAVWCASPRDHWDPVGRHIAADACDEHEPRLAYQDSYTHARFGDGLSLSDEEINAEPQQYLAGRGHGKAPL